MVQIKHKGTGKVIHQVGGSTLVGAKLAGAKLAGADLHDANMTRVDLEAADLTDANLQGTMLPEARLHFTNLVRANLSGAFLNHADLHGADLRDACLQGTELTGAYLRKTTLAGADLTQASLDYALLVEVDMKRVDLRQAYLGNALLGADLTDANLSGATFGYTHIVGATGLRSTAGLAEARHSGPSTVDVFTLRADILHLPEAFLHGVGLTQEEIQVYRSLATSPRVSYSCFLSHAASDAEFVDRLYADLRGARVDCWHYRYDMRGGRFWRAQIDQAINRYDKLLLVCSRNSVQRPAVVDEVIAAMERERHTRSRKLFPIRLDDFILGDEMRALADEKMKSKEWPEDWITYIRTYHIPDFSSWRRKSLYQVEFNRLLDALKNPEER